MCVRLYNDSLVTFILQAHVKGKKKSRKIKTDDPENFISVSENERPLSQECLPDPRVTS